MENAKKYLTPEECIYSQEISNDISEFIYKGPKVDLIFSHAVIHHFPTLLYFEKVLELWKIINPEYIAVQVKLSNKTKEAKKYEKQFLNGLFLDERDLLSYFNKIGYNVVSSDYNVTLNKKIKLGYYVFRKQKSN